MNTCYFCGLTDDRISRDHIWPKWVSRILLRIGRGNVVYHLQSNAESTIANWRSAIINVTAESLCEPCNKKWLGRFENEVVKPVAAPLIWGNDTIILDLQAQRTLAAWAYKMAMLVIIGGNQLVDPFFRPGERRAFRDTTVAHSYVWVLLSKYDFGQRPAHATNQEHRLSPLDGGAPLILKVITFSVGSLAMQVVAVRSVATGELVSGGELGGVIFEGTAVETLLPIWPPSFPSLRWPPARTMDHLAVEQWTSVWAESFNVRPPFTC